MWNRESWAFESGKQLKEYGIPLAIGIQNLRSTDKDSWNPVPGIQSPESTAWNSDSNLAMDQDQQYRITLKLEGKADRTAMDGSFI